MLSLPVILDCDPGTDDALALLLAFGAPELDVRAVTVAGGNVGLERTLTNALSLTALAGREIPVHGGAERPLLGAYSFAPEVHGDDGLGGVLLPTGHAPAPGLAADAIRTILRNATAPVTIVGIAPATNIALALMTEPALAARIGADRADDRRLGRGQHHALGRVQRVERPGGAGRRAHRGRPVCIAPLDLTAQALVTPSRVAALRARGGGQCLRAACDILAAVAPSQRLGGAGFPLHDPCTIAWLIRPDLFSSRECAVSVDLGPGPSRGRTVIDRWGRTRSPPNAMVLETLDADAFFTLLGDRLARLP